MFFNRFAFLQAIHRHYQSQASSMPSKEEWFTYDTTVFLHLNNHIHNQKKRNARKKTRKWWTFTARNGISSHHLQPLFRFLFLFLMCHTDLSLYTRWRGRTAVAQSEITEPRQGCSIYSRLYNEKSAKALFLHPVCYHSSLRASTIRCSAKWSQIVVT